MKKIYLIFLAVLLIAACGTSTEKRTGSDEAAATAINPEAIETIRITVTGMTCGGCERTVKAAVAELPGVQEVEASATDSVAIVSFDTTLVSFAQMQEAINAKGYTAEDFVVVEKEGN
jgi:copper chaperone CopZ